MPAVRHLRQTPPPAPPEMRVEITTPATDAPLQFALSPDGRSLVFVASGDGPPRLWLRPLDQTEARPLAGTEGATYPFWSPDSRSIGFFAAGKLLRLDVAGGAPQVLATADGDEHRRQLERGRHDPVSAAVDQPVVARRGRRGRAGGGDAARSATPDRAIATRSSSPTAGIFCSTRRARPRRRGSTWGRSTAAHPRG